MHGEDTNFGATNRADLPGHSYGYQTSTRLRIVLSLALTEETVRDNDIKTVIPTLQSLRLSSFPVCADFRRYRQIFRAIHNAYISYLANPFNEAIQDNQTSVEYIQPPIRSRGFTKKLEQIANAQNE